MPAQRKSAAPLVIMLLVLLAAGGGALWLFVLRDKAAERGAPIAATQSDASVQVAGDPSARDASGNHAEGSDGSGSAGAGMSGTGAGSSGGSSDSGTAPSSNLVDTVIVASVANATIEVVGTDHKGASPLTAKLEKDRSYQARVSAPGFVTQEVLTKGGAAQQTVKLAPKPRMITVTSTPDKAQIHIDGAPTGKTTPATVQLSKAQGAKKSVRVRLSKAGFKPVEKMVATDAYKEEDAQMKAAIETKLDVAPRVPTGGTGSAGSGAVPGSDGGSGDGAGSSSGPAPDKGSGTEAPPGGGGSAEPEPNL